MTERNELAKQAKKYRSFIFKDDAEDFKWLGKALTRNFDVHKRQDLEDENGNPAQRIGDHDGEKAFGNCQLFLNVVAIFGRLCSCPLDIIKHAPIGQQDDEKSHQVQTY